MKEMRRFLNTGSRDDSGPYAVALGEMHKSLERYTFTEVLEEVVTKVVKATKDAVGDWISLS